MGQNGSQLEKELGADRFPQNEHYFGLVNFGNTCYCNSVLQALYYTVFRDRVLAYKQQSRGSKRDNLLSALADLFHNVASQKRRVGTLAPKKFIQKLKRENEAFDNFQQQDAHEFFNYLINHVGDILIEEKKAAAGGGKEAGKAGKHHHHHQQQQQQQVTQTDVQPDTFVHEIFQGTLTNETRCLNCENVRHKDENFLDLSVDIEQNANANANLMGCLKCFSNLETMQHENKYFCEFCASKQEATKRMRLKKLPPVLALHLKRFKFIEQMSRHVKVNSRVVFPLELSLSENFDESDANARVYDLVSVVVHCGCGPNRGHYITIVKSHGIWLLFDDDIVEKIDTAHIEEFYGLGAESGRSNDSGYLLFYQARDVTPQQQPQQQAAAK